MYRFRSDITSDSQAAPYRRQAGNEAGEDPAVLLLDGDRKVVMASPSARAMLDAGPPLVLIAGALSATVCEDAVALSTAFRALVTGREAIRSIRLGDEAGEVALQLVALRGDERRVQVIVTIRSLGIDRSVALGQIAQRFGLTPAELRLLKMLCGGASLVEASARLGVARTTARTHLQRIFDKSGTHRQAELVRMVFAA